jgi:AcrR family transcriptional regulator
MGIRGDATRDLLCATALRLWADEGLEVTVNRIVEDAGLKNPSAVRFHFGGREGLIDAVVEKYTKRIEAEVRLSLESEPDGDGRRLVELVVEPYIRLLEGSEEDRRYVLLVAQLVGRPGRDLTQWAPRLPSMLQALQQAMSVDGDVPPSLVGHRIYAASLLLLNLLARRASPANPPGISIDVFTQTVIDEVLGTLTAPLNAATLDVLEAEQGARRR